MAKILSAPRSMQSARLTVRVPIGMIEDMRTDMARNKYSSRKQSRWVEEAVESFLETKSFPELIAEDFIAPGNNKPIRISLNGEMADEIEKATKLASDQENITDTKSKLVRAAIRQRLLASGLGF